MHGTGQTTKSMPDYREPQMMRHGRRYFVISPGSIPLNIKVSRDVVFTLQKKLFILTVVRGYIRCEMTPTSVGGEQQNYISGGIQSPI